LTHQDYKIKSHKRVLLVSYNFPPIEGPRSIRWIYFIKYLSKYGYQFDVLTVGKMNKTIQIGFGMINSLPSSVRIHRVHPGLFYWITRKVLPQKEKGIKECAYKSKGVSDSRVGLRIFLRKLYRSVFSDLFIPDKTAEWIISGTWRWLRLRREKYDLIVSNAFPFSSHILGYVYARATGAPWIVDYGDPWTFGSMSEFSRWRQKLNKAIERRALKKACHIVVTTEETKRGFLSNHPFLSGDNISVVSQGFDPTIYETAPAEKGKMFRIVYTGIFYDRGRNPYAFFCALKNLTNLDIEVIMVGDILTHQMQIVNELGLEKKVVFLGKQSFERCIELQKGADVLLLIGNDSRLQLPSKIFDYFGARRPILVLKNCNQGLAARMVKQHKRGLVVDGTNVEHISKAISELHKSWQLNKLNARFDLSGLSVEKYTWQSSAKKMSKIFEKLC